MNDRMGWWAVYGLLAVALVLALLPFAAFALYLLRGDPRWLGFGR